MFEPFNDTYSCKSFVNTSDYGISSNAWGSNLTNLRHYLDEEKMRVSEFQITELEVWEIMFEK